MSLNIETAVIPVAGVGTRMLPATWGIEKCMLPIYSGGSTRLILDWMVEECSKAGIKRIIFVTSDRGKEQIRGYLEAIDPIIAERYHSYGKGSFVEKERERRDAYGIHYEYVIEGPGLYGTSVPPYLARQYLQGEKHFFLMGGDDFVYHQDPKVSELSLAIKTWEDSGCDNVIMGCLVKREDAPRFGVLFGDENNNLTHWIEKPKPDQLPDQEILTANISRYGFSDSIWDYIEEELKVVRDTEHYITYPVVKALQSGKSFRIHPLQGKYLGGGTPEELIEAGAYIKEHPAFSAES